MRTEYDFRGGVRGKYAEQMREGSNIVIIDDELRADFPNQQAVNDALRELLRRRRDEGAA